MAVHCHYRYGHFSGCVADTRRTVPYPPCYRILEPVEDPFGSGYQLTQSLMAFGRGELWGQGLGNSVQNWSICRKRTLTLFSPLSAKNWGMSVWCWHFNGILRRFSRDVDWPQSVRN